MKVPLVEEASPFVWMIFFLVAIAGVVFLQKVYQIFIKKDHHLPKAKKGLSFLLFISCITLVSCMWGYYWQLYTFKEPGNFHRVELQAQ